MKKKLDNKTTRRRFKNHVRADVIVLGCSLPGIVTAHNLKKKFGTSMEIMVLDLSNTAPRREHSTGVAFKDIPQEDEEEDDQPYVENTVPAALDNVARFYLDKYSRDLRIPNVIHTFQKIDPNLNKLFQHTNGTTANCPRNFHEFEYLNKLERFELIQYQNLLDHNMLNLFTAAAANTESDRKNLLYYDRTSMEEHICSKLMMSTSREVMRTIVKLVCGTEAHEVSVLFYLHQCYRTNSSKNHLDGDNTRFREKLIGKFRKRLDHTLKESVADITLTPTQIKEIRTSTDERVVLEPVKGETDYRCNLLAMALTPAQLKMIEVGADLLDDSDREIAAAMKQGAATKFTIQYERRFWRLLGYSGDILSVKGPILWAIERPKVSTTRSSDKYAALIGYLKVNPKGDSKKDVVEQLVKLFGPEAANPVSYKESPIEDIFVPRCGDYVALRRMTTESSQQYLEWAALDIFAEGDVAAAVEAGHTAYLHLLSILRPQAINYEDVSTGEWPVNYPRTYDVLLANINLQNTSRVVLYGMALGIGVHVLRKLWTH